MKMIKTYTPSINIERDFEENTNYIPTPNAQLVFSQIVSNYHKGSRSFNLIGAYGSGKSSFILALEQSLRGQFNYFDCTKLFNEKKDFQFLNIVGENESLINTFADILEIKDATPKKTINKLNKFYQELSSENKALIIVIDEFGKFLEYAAKNNPERELYFIQQLAEFVNDISKEVIFLTVLHQNFGAYSLDLTSSQFNEWKKVKGRLVELNFNEPIEQLIFLASKRIPDVNLENFNKKQLENTFDLIEKSRLLSLKDYNSFEFSLKLLPFDLLSINVLTKALQEYAQNERSLFSFIENDDYLGLKDFDSNSSPFFNIANVYDYLIFYYFSFLSTKFNHHLNQWSAIKNSIERVENGDFENIPETVKIIKTIGLLNIFSNQGGRIDNEFLIDYSKNCLGIEMAEPIIEKLVKNKIIRFSKYNGRYKIFEGTDLDIELEIDKAGNLIEKIKDVTHYLNKYFDFPLLPAKKVSYQKGTPRFFSFILSEEPISKTPEDEIDGFINLIFNENLVEEAIIEASLNCEEAILFGHFTNTDKIREVIFNLEKVKKVIEKIDIDKFALNELNKILEHYKKLLNHYVINSLYKSNSSIVWYFKGEKISIENRKDFNSQLSQICNRVYSETPVFRNELVNKTKISSVISTARKSLLSRLLTNVDRENLGYGENEYPADKSIYLSLLKSTGIHKHENGEFVLTKPNDTSFNSLWEISYSYLYKTKAAKLPISDFISILKSKPLKLKQGFVDFWIPVFLLINKDNFALYYKKEEEPTYIPQMTNDVLELIYKAPKDYYVKAFDLSPKKIEIFNKYREILNQIEETPSNQTFIETFKPFIIFSKEIPEFSRQTKKLSKKSISLRTVLFDAIEPEKVFFEDFPNALGFKLSDFEKDDKAIEDFAISLKESIQEINFAYDRLINEIESYINNEIFGEQIAFPENKNILQKRYKSLKTEKLPPKLKVFYQRIITLLDDRKSWINSISQACIGKGLDKIKDNEIELLKIRIIDNIRELDNLSEISAKDIDSEKEELIKLEIASLAKGLSKKYVRIPKSKLTELTKLESSIKEQLNKTDKAINIALLTKILQEQIKDDE
jgi:hypothetical protein